MLKRLEIRNFRVFKALEIDQLSRLNLIYSSFLNRENILR